MFKRIAAAFAAGLFTVLMATTVLAAGTTTIVHDNGATCDPKFAGSPCFGPPNTGIKPGDKTTLTLTWEQTAPQPNATVKLSWDGALTFTGNGDTTAVCTAGTNSETCVYTDSAHTDKSDSYNFTVGNQPAGTTITTTIEVATGTSTFTAVGTTGGCDKATATLTMAAAPTPTPSPAPSASATPTPSPVASVPVPPTGLGPTLPIAAGLVVLGLATVALAIRRKGDLA